MTAKDKLQIIGYARVSSTGQSLELQLDKLNGFDCGAIFKEKISGTSTKKRIELQNCLNHLRNGDSLVITKLDRLARSVSDLSKIVEELKSKDVDLVVLDQNIDTSTPYGKLTFHLLGAFAEFENDLRKERQAEGIKKALDKGISFGRKKNLSKEQTEELKKDREAGLKITEIMKKYEISKKTVYRYLNSNS
jgi:DNA invertase Pin-like site-specific DNA recombinase